MESPSLNWVAAGILFGIFQILLLLYFALSQKSRPGNLFYAGFIGVLLITQIEAFFNRSGFMALVPHLLNTGTPFIFLFGPLLYFHSRSLLGNSISKVELWLHTSPFLFYFAYSFFFFLQPAQFKYMVFMRSFFPGVIVEPSLALFPTDPLNIQGLVVVELLSLHILMYSVYNLFLTKKEPSAISSSRKSWLYFVNGLLLVGAIILFFSQGGIINGSRFLGNILPQFSADLYPTLATYLLSFYLLKLGVVSMVKPPKYFKSSMTEENRINQRKKIIEKIENEKLYLDPEFSLNSLSKACNLNKHNISQILNEEMGCTFFELTHSYRITEAKRLLKESDDFLKMEQLAYELGYKSKSTFFSAFKKATELTPTQYRDIRSI